MLLYLLLRRLGVGLVPALLLSFYAMYAKATIQIFPRASNFAVALILLFSYLATFIRKRSQFYLFISFSMLVVSYARPEYMISMFLLLLLAAGSYYYVSFHKKFILTKQDTLFILLLTGLSVAFIYLNGGLPLGGGRSFLAFKHHFSVHWVVYTGSLLNHWLDADQIVQDNFGEVSSIWDCFASEPLLFFEHMLRNVMSLYRGGVRSILPSPMFFFPYEFRVLERILFLLVVSGMLFWTFRKNTFKNILHRVKKDRWVHFCLAVLFPAPIVWLVIFPRPWHFTVPLYISLVLLSVLFFRYGTVFSRIGKKGMLCIFLLLLLLSPSSYSSPEYQHSSTAFNVGVRIISVLKNYPLRASQINHFDVGTTGPSLLKYYFGDKMQWKRKPFDETFYDFLDRENINLIFYTEGEPLPKNFGEGVAQWQNFLQNYTRCGFKKLKVPQTNCYLLMQDSLHSQQF